MDISNPIKLSNYKITLSMKRSFFTLCTLLTISALGQKPVLDFVYSTKGTTGVETRFFDITVDNAGNSYSIGVFQGEVDFDPGDEELILTSTFATSFFRKLDASGNLVWVQYFQDHQVYPKSIAVDDFENVYITGYFSGTNVDLDPGPGVLSFSVPHTSTFNDVFILKLNAAGELIWVKQIGGQNSDVGEDIAVDQEGNLYITGYFRNTVDFDPGDGVYHLSSPSSNDIFICKLDNDGEFIWAKQFAGTGSTDAGFSIALDGDGNVYSAGRFSGTADFNPDDEGVFNLTTNGGWDVFVSKLDNNGDFIWAKNMGSGADDVCREIILDDNQNVYLTGVFRGTADFDPGVDVFNLVTGIGNINAFVCKLGSDGQLVWAKKFGANNQITEGYSIALDDDANVYTTGFYRGPTDFDPSEDGVFNLSPSSFSIFEHDIFISKLDSDGHFVWAAKLGGDGRDVSCSIAADQNGNIYSIGYFGYLADFDPSCDTFELTPTASYDVYLCKLSQQNCNSVCASVDVEACGSYIVDGVTYNQSGVYELALTSFEGCDSTLTLNLTISETTIDLSVTQAEHTLTANASNATYQWIDCDNSNAPISGATSQSYTPISTGNYAVEITTANCSGISECMAVTIVSVNELDGRNMLSVYPNPSSGIFTVVMNHLNQTRYEIYDITGHRIENGFSTSKQFTINILDLPAGVYLLRIHDTTHLLKKVN